MPEHQPKHFRYLRIFAGSIGGAVSGDHGLRVLVEFLGPQRRKALWLAENLGLTRIGVAFIHIGLAGDSHEDLHIRRRARRTTAPPLAFDPRSLPEIDR